ncbi:MAG: serine O-acetyltransferase [Gammaproteobacteria bacterium]|nr:serine O-acetyltransferase [Gammaproteobacteria bacterium]
MNHKNLSEHHCQDITLKVWAMLRDEATALSEKEPLLASYAHSCVLKHNKLGASLAFILSNKLADGVMPAMTLYELFLEAYDRTQSIECSAANDLVAVVERDPAIDQHLSALLYLKGFQAIQIHRIAHFLWHAGRAHVALYIQSRNSVVSGVDIHPAARIGQGVMFDHATGIVVGETAIIEDNVSILQGVTLGGTGKVSGDRHPKVRKNVMIGSGAKILGNIEIGEGAKVGAGSVVLRDVCAHTTVVGVPAVKVGEPKTNSPCHEMNQNVLDDANGDVDLSSVPFQGSGI